MPPHRIPIKFGTVSLTSGSELEQRMRSNLYSNKDEVYEHIRELKVALANEKLSFYCPLEGNIYNNEFCELVPCDESLLVESQSKIEVLLENEQSFDCDMAKFVGEQSGIGEHLILAECKVEKVDGELYGRIDCYLDGKLDESELENSTASPSDSARCTRAEHGGSS